MTEMNEFEHDMVAYAKSRLLNILDKEYFDPVKAYFAMRSAVNILDKALGLEETYSNEQN